MCKAVEIRKKGVLRYHSDIKFLPKHVTVKNIHIDIIAPNFTSFYRRLFKIFKIIFFMDGTQKKMKLSRKVITHPSFASFFVCEIKK